ncbi:hypothetical protein TWF730_006682 [Orbilia blumenaviensis]|uniref:Uncharacterized protein n=1 Tax=Orbilia blumenaviensis TaxID=1796055 RepID=A0AAV9VEZ0_9PEZI
MPTNFYIEHQSIFALIESLQAQIKELKLLLPTKLYNNRLELATQQLHFPPIPISPGDRQHLPNTGKELRMFDVRECDAACRVLGIPISSEDTVTEKRSAIAEYLGVPSDFL